MTDDYTVHDEPDFARTYDEDETVEIRKGDLRAVLDVATMSMDFGSGFLDNEQVEALRKIAEIIGIDPLLATPSNFTCHYGGQHQWRWQANGNWTVGGRATFWHCLLCRHMDFNRPGPEDA